MIIERWCSSFLPRDPQSAPIRDFEVTGQQVLSPDLVNCGAPLRSSFVHVRLLYVPFATGMRYSMCGLPNISLSNWDE